MDNLFNGKGSIRMFLKEVGTVIALFAVTAFLAGCGGGYSQREGYTVSYEPSFSLSVIDTDSTR